MNDSKKYDVAIVGAGPAGILAAIKAGESGKRVLLIERNKDIGNKILLTGNGRCNITNAEFNLRELVKKYNNGEFLYHSFFIFGPKETIEFFNKNGLETKVEANKRVFPKSDDAHEVINILKNILKKNNVEVLFNSKVVDVKKKGKKIEKLVLEIGEVVAKNYIICAGGRSYPNMGSDGSGYELSKKLGHTIVDTTPALAPIKIKEPWIDGLKGVSLRDVRVSVLLEKKKITEEEGEIIFTHFGVSGPAILNISSVVGKSILKGDLKICIDLFPLLNYDQLLLGFEQELKRYPSKTIKNILSIFMPERMAEVLLNTYGIDKEKIGNNLPKTERFSIIKILKNIELTPVEVLGYDLAKTTRGGVMTKEIDTKTMKSKIINNLFFAGEIIDVDGKSGGFNLQMCWSTGFLAGSNID